MKMRTNNLSKAWGCVLASCLLLATQVPSCANGGIGGSGGVSGFGSIFVNGVEWFTDTTEFLLDGVPGAEDELQVGMVVGFEGRIDPLRATGVVTRVTFDDDVEGPVTAIHVDTTAQKTLTILGHSVVIRDGFTRFDVTDPALGYDTISGGDVLEVSGYVDGEGGILASWVRRVGTFVPGETHVELEGTIADFGGGAAFRLGPIVIVTIASTDLSALPGGLANGVEVEVEGKAITPTLVVATEVSVPEGLPTNVAELSVEGIVTDFQGLESFRVAGQQVDATNAEFEPTDATFVANGALIEAEGRLVGGILVADSIELSEAVVEIKAPVATAGDLDPAANRLWLLGVEVALDPATEIIDERDQLEGFSVFDIAPGDFLVVEGSRMGSGGMRTTRLVRTEADEVDVRGPVDDFDAPTGQIDVLGVVIRVGAETELRDPTGVQVSSSAFFANLSLGRMLRVIGLEPAAAPGEWIATKIKPED